MVVKYCPACGHENLPRESFCTQCDFDLLTVPTEARRVAPALAAEGETASEVVGETPVFQRMATTDHCRLELLDNAETSFEIASGQSVGRGVEADVLLSGVPHLNYISRRHALFSRRGDQWFVQYVASGNFVKVDGEAYDDDSMVALHDGSLFNAFADLVSRGAPMSLHFEIAGCSHPGRVRAKNDDYFCLGNVVGQNDALAFEFESSSDFFCNFGLLCAVADGMGGYEGGAVASKAVLESLSTLFYARRHAGMTADELAAELEHDFDRVRLDLDEKLSHDGLLDAGTTVAGVALLPPDIAVVFHCGDSRVLRASGGYVRALTLDHAPLAAEVAAGRIDESSAATSALATKISRSLGIQGDSRVEINASFTWDDGDTFLLCSDGFHGLGRGLTLPMLREHSSDFEQTSAKDVVTAWVQEAVTVDGCDNATLVQIKISMPGPRQI